MSRGLAIWAAMLAVTAQPKSPVGWLEYRVRQVAWLGRAVGNVRPQDLEPDQNRRAGVGRVIADDLDPVVRARRIACTASRIA